MTQLLSLAIALSGPPAVLDAPFLALSAGKPISVSVGHADPLWQDMTGDGLPDLLVGEFGGGTLRLYPNSGKLGAPKFGAFQFVKAKDQNATVESG